MPYRLCQLGSLGLVWDKLCPRGSVPTVIIPQAPASASLALVCFFMPQQLPISAISHPADDFLSSTKLKKSPKASPGDKRVMCGSQVLRCALETSSLFCQIRENTQMTLPIVQGPPDSLAGSWAKSLFPL